MILFKEKAILINLSLFNLPLIINFIKINAVFLLGLIVNFLKFRLFDFVFILQKILALRGLEINIFIGHRKPFSLMFL